VTVVAPQVDQSGSGAAVGPIHSREGVDYEMVPIDGLERALVYGIDGTPALAVILACLGTFGPPPDLVLSGINLGINVGRAALHSGTVGAALTASQFKISGLAVSLRFGPAPRPWETASTLAIEALEVLGGAPAGTVLNLNVPDVAIDEVRGIRNGTLGRAGTIRSAATAPEGDHSADASDDVLVAETSNENEWPAIGKELGAPSGPSGVLRLDLGMPGGTRPDDLTTDAGLIQNNFASITALVGVHDAGEAAADTVELALQATSKVLNPKR
jgi:broad specificity polyphosphatase/5'/3'-nucleotidase SurE